MLIWSSEAFLSQLFKTVKMLTIHLLFIPEWTTHAMAAINSQWPPFNLQISGIQCTAQKKEPHPYRVGTKCVLFFLFNRKKEVSLASVFSLILLTYEFNGQFFIISGACRVEATILFIGKKNSSLYHFYAGWKMDWRSYLYITKILLLTILWFYKSNQIRFWSTCMWVKETVH